MYILLRCLRDSELKWKKARKQIGESSEFKHCLSVILRRNTLWLGTFSDIFKRDFGPVRTLLYCTVLYCMYSTVRYNVRKYRKGARARGK
jgi:hypothetical protein